MSTPITVSTLSLKKTKNVEIDGVSFKVRRFGAGEQLSVMQLQRRINALSKTQDPTEEQEDQIISLSQEVLGIVANLFDDMADGSETKKLMSRIDLEDIQLMLEQIFKEKNEDGNTKT